MPKIETIEPKIEMNAEGIFISCKTTICFECPEASWWGKVVPAKTKFTSASASKMPKIKTSAQGTFISCKTTNCFKNHSFFMMWHWILATDLVVSVCVGCTLQRHSVHFTASLTVKGEPICFVLCSVVLLRGVHCIVFLVFRFLQARNVYMTTISSTRLTC